MTVLLMWLWIFSYTAHLLQRGYSRTPHTSYREDILVHRTPLTERICSYTAHLLQRGYAGTPHTSYREDMLVHRTPLTERQIANFKVLKCVLAVLTKLYPLYMWYMETLMLPEQHTKYMLTGVQLVEIWCLTIKQYIGTFNQKFRFFR